MTTTYPAAIDEMYARFFALNSSLAPAIVGSIPLIRWRGRDTNLDVIVNRFYWEVNQLTATERQSAFGVSSKLYTTTGTMYLKLFAPQIGADNYNKGRNLANAVKKGFRTPQIGAKVWYRGPRIQELSPDKGFYLFNVIVDYTYDERQ